MNREHTNHSVDDAGDASHLRERASRKKRREDSTTSRQITETNDSTLDDKAAAHDTTADTLLASTKKKARKGYSQPSIRLEDGLDDGAVQPSTASTTAEDPQEWQDFRPYLNTRTLGAVKELMWTKPTLVQRAVIPLILQGRNVMLHAPTGCGKTAAFLIPLLEVLLQSRGSVKMNSLEGASQSVQLRAVILVPSTELAHQTLAVIRSLTQYMLAEFHFQELLPFTALMSKSIWGVNAPRVIDIAVTTPAVLYSHVRSETAAANAFRGTRYVVMDEADSITSMVSMTNLKAYFPSNSQIVMVSATLSRVVQELRQMYLRKPAIVTLEEEDDLGDTLEDGKVVYDSQALRNEQQRISEHYVTVSTREDRYTYLYAILRSLISTHAAKPRKYLIFVANTFFAYSVKIFLQSFDIETYVVHADIPKESREHILSTFNAAASGQLIACDDGDDMTGYGVRRGLDFSNITHVLIFNCTFDTSVSSLSAYTQRIGRTGRAKKKGTSILFLSPSEIEEALPVYQEDCARRSGKSITPYPDIEPTMIYELRYRCTDVVQTISKKRVNNMRVKDIAAQILNCEKLQHHFQKHEKDHTTLKDLVSKDKLARQRASTLTCVPFYMKSNEVVSTTMPQQPASSAEGFAAPGPKKKKSSRTRSAQDPLTHFRLHQKRKNR